MAVFAGKTPAERNKLIAAIVLGVVSLGALYFAFGRGLFSSSATTATSAKSSPTPKPVNSPAANRPAASMPSAADQDLDYQTQPVVYNPSSISAPEPGRNIFAFFEPPVPTPYVPPPPKPTATPTPSPTPTPAPTPVYLVQGASPSAVYAGSQTFPLNIMGDRFTPDAHVYFNQVEVPTKFASPQQLTAQVPASMIAQPGQRQIIVQNPGGTAYSNPVMLTVQDPPKPTFQYIGMIARKRFNNDTAYFSETGRPLPFGARLNDVVGGRFRLIEITANDVTFEDTQLGFKHKVQITKAPAATGNGQPVRPNGFDNGFPQMPPNMMPGMMPQPQPPQPAQPKQDVDDDGGE